MDESWYIPAILILLLLTLIFGLLWGLGTGQGETNVRSLRYEMSTELLPRTEKAKYRVWIQLIGDSYLNLTPKLERLGIDPATSHFSAPVLRYGSTGEAGGDAPLLGTTASEGLKGLAELGTTETFTNETVAAGQKFEVFKKSNSVTQDYEIEIELDPPGDGKSATIEMFSMLAPSPDWLAYGGSNMLTDAPEATWRNFTVLPILLVDAGTDAGLTAKSPDNVQTPRLPVQLLGISVPFVGFLHMVRVP